MTDHETTSAAMLLIAKAILLAEQMVARHEIEASARVVDGFAVAAADPEVCVAMREAAAAIRARVNP